MKEGIKDDAKEGISTPNTGKWGNLKKKTVAEHGLANNKPSQLEQERFELFMHFQRYGDIGDAYGRISTQDALFKSIRENDVVKLDEILSKGGFNIMETVPLYVEAEDGSFRRANTPTAPEIAVDEGNEEVINLVVGAVLSQALADHDMEKAAHLFDYKIQPHIPYLQKLLDPYPSYYFSEQYYALPRMKKDPQEWAKKDKEVRDWLLTKYPDQTELHAVYNDRFIPSLAMSAAFTLRTALSKKVGEPGDFKTKEAKSEVMTKLCETPYKTSFKDTEAYRKVFLQSQSEKSFVTRVQQARNGTQTVAIIDHPYLLEKKVERKQLPPHLEKKTPSFSK